MRSVAVSLNGSQSVLWRVYHDHTHHPPRQRLPVERLHQRPNQRRVLSEAAPAAEVMAADPVLPNAVADALARQSEIAAGAFMTITFYATMSCDHLRPFMADVPILLPASSWSRKNMRKPNLPPHVQHVAADSGGFVATFKWGDYRYTPEQYVKWLDSFQPRWAATMDYCCEREVAANAGIVRQRQQRTTDMAYLFWKHYRSISWAWVPTVQGWYVEDYIRHARELRPLIEEMGGAGNPYFRVGIGTLCARASAKMVHEVVQAVAEQLPGIPLHLWGVKLGVLQSPYELPQVISVDSAAWEGLMFKGRTEWQQCKGRMTQKEYAHNIALPRYLAKVEAAIGAPKRTTIPRQKTLWELMS